MQSYNITDLFHPFADIQGSGVGGGGVLGKFLDPRMFSFVTQLLNIVRLFMLQIVC